MTSIAINNVIHSPALYYPILNNCLRYALRALNKIILSTIMIVTLLASGSSYLLSSNAYAASTTSQGCTVVSIDNQIQLQKSDFSAVPAYPLAESSSAYLSLLQNSSVQSIGATGIWKFDMNTCSASLASINVVFSFVSSTGVNQYLYVGENANASQVLGSTLQTAVGATNSVTWSGYEYYVSSGVNYVEADWGLPSASAPSTGCSTNNECILLDWTGGSIGAGGASGLAQGGSGDTVVCPSSSCTSYYTDYFAWYEFYGVSCGQPGCGVSGLVNCTANQFMTVSSGDDIENYIDYTPSNSTMNEYVNDLTDGYSCTNLIYIHDGAVTMNQPYYGQFIAERPEIGTSGSYYSLPDFQTTVIADAYVDGSQINNLSPSSTYNMVNSGNTNINLGSVNYNTYIGAYFDETWSTSSGT